MFDASSVDNHLKYTASKCFVKHNSYDGETNSYIDDFDVALDMMVKRSVISLKSGNLAMYYAKSNTDQVNMYYSSYGSGFDQNLLRERAFLTMASYLYVLCLLIPLYLTVFSLVNDKRLGITNLLRQWGVNESQYFTSHFLFFTFTSVTASVLAFGAKIFLDVYSKNLAMINSFSFLFALMSSLLLSASLGMFLSSLMRRPTVVNVVLGFLSITFILLCYIFNLDTSGNLHWLYLSHVVNPDAFFAIGILFPWFTISKTFANSVILQVSTAALDKATTDYAIKEAKRIIDSLDEESSNLYWISFIGCFIYFFMAWYISQVSGDRDSTTRRSYFFIFQRSYWTGISRHKSLVEGDTHSILKQKSLTDQSIIIKKLSKIYSKGATAVKELSVSFSRGYCYTLLGHNGAGKTTLINMLTGGIFPTNGDAYILGASIKSESSLIFSKISVCPQEDILWDRLTAGEHVMIAARLK